MKKRRAIFLLTGLMLTGCYQAINTQAMSIPSKVSPVKSETENAFDDIIQANQGNAKAQFNIGKAYYDGHGVGQDYAKAIEWFTKSAEQGYVPAQYQLGTLYNYGEGARQDYYKAAKWYLNASNQGDARSQYNLGMMYYAGHGVRTNLVIAKKYFAKACDNGYQLGCNNLDILIEKD